MITMVSNQASGVKLIGFHEGRAHRHQMLELAEERPAMVLRESDDLEEERECECECECECFHPGGETRESRGSQHLVDEGLREIGQ